MEVNHNNMSKRILLVDDNLEFAFLVEEILKGEDYEIISARTAKEALNLAKGVSYDAFILDLNLPDYTGYYLGKKLKERFSDTPIAVLTNYDGDTSRESARLLNAEFWYKADTVRSKANFIEKLERLLDYGEEKRFRNS